MARISSAAERCFALVPSALPAPPGRPGRPGKDTSPRAGEFELERKSASYAFKSEGESAADAFAATAKSLYARRDDVEAEASGAVRLEASVYSSAPSAARWPALPALWLWLAKSSCSTAATRRAIADCNGGALKRCDSASKLRSRDVGLTVGDGSSASSYASEGDFVEK